jgi:tRNA dimethylallyltransferase
VKNKKLIVIVGPTAVGKTGIAVRLARQLNTEIISADSRQVFRELEIGTAKPAKAELALVTHHFINSKSITEDYDAGQYGRDALDVIQQLFEKKEVVILCGGSGLYVQAVCDGFDEMPEVPEGIREKIMAEYEEKGLGWLQRQLEQTDPDYFAGADQKNPHRLVRALELNYATGKPVGEFRQRKKREHPFTIIKIGLELERAELYRRIDLRMDSMVEAGLFEEAKKFHPMKDLQALQTVGYQEIFGYFEGRYDRHEAIRLLKRNSRRYAKRQLTWFKKDKAITWFAPEQYEAILSLIV